MRSNHAETVLLVDCRTLCRTGQHCRSCLTDCYPCTPAGTPCLQNYSNKEDENITSGVVVPLLPFGMPKYDAGERFDLRSPYADDGWVDPEETDAWAGFKKIGEKLLNFTGKTQKQVSTGVKQPVGTHALWLQATSCCVDMTGGAVGWRR